MTKVVPVHEASTYPRWLVLVLALLSLVGCHGAIDGVPILLSTPEGEISLEMADGEKLPAGEELIIAGSGEGYTVSFTGENAAPSAETLRLVVTGDPRKGNVRFFTGEREGGVSFTSLFEIDDMSWNALVANRVELILPVPSWMTPDGLFGENSGLTFFAGTGRQYRVESITFGPARSQQAVGVGEEELFTVDYRMPFAVEEGRWVVTPASGPSGRDQEAYEISYRWLERAEGNTQNTGGASADDASAVGASFFTNSDNRPYATIGDGTTLIRWNLRPRDGRTTFRPSLWGLPGVKLEIALGDRDIPVQLSGISVVSDPRGPLDPLPAELSELSMHPVSAWRSDEFELFSWSVYPNVLWIDSISYAVQSSFFKRMAFFVEKRGYIGSLLTDDELSGLHGYNAHNYRPEGLADFYNAVEAEKFPLNPHELLLRDVAEHNGIMFRDASGAWQPGEGGVLGVSRESIGDHRRLLVVHEAMHGVIYEEDEFHQGVADYWRSHLSERERQYWRDMLGWMGYTPEDEYLMYNEFQAYLLQRSEATTRWYFRSLMADRVRYARGRSEPVENFLADHPTTFVDSARAINDLLYRTTGLIGGNPFCLEAVTE